MAHIKFSILLVSALVFSALTGAPVSAAPIPAHSVDQAGTSNPLLHKVHRWRGRWHCNSRHDTRRGWHWHKRACRGKNYRYRHKPRHHYGGKYYNRKGCWWSPRYGLRCQF